MDFWIWIIIIVIVSISFVTILAVTTFRNTSNKKKAMEAHLDCLNEFTATQKVMGSSGNTGLAIDEQRKKFVC